jgi:hypothetical protein
VVHYAAGLEVGHAALYVEKLLQVVEQVSIRCDVEDHSSASTAAG